MVGHLVKNAIIYVIYTVLNHNEKSLSVVIQIYKNYSNKYFWIKNQIQLAIRDVKIPIKKPDQNDFLLAKIDVDFVILAPEILLPPVATIESFILFIF